MAMLLDSIDRITPEVSSIEAQKAIDYLKEIDSDEIMLMAAVFHSGKRVDWSQKEKDILRHVRTVKLFIEEHGIQSLPDLGVLVTLYKRGMIKLHCSNPRWSMLIDTTKSSSTLERMEGAAL